MNSCGNRTKPYDFQEIVQGSYSKIAYDLYDIIYDAFMIIMKRQPGRIRV